MAIIEHCFCCGLAIAAGFLAVYLLIAFLIAFGFELLWILESDSALPTAALLLCIGYFILALSSAILVHGLATKNTLCLVIWIFTVSVLVFPEAGMVIYMSVQFWKIESQYGITELICWFARILANVIEIIIVQSLYSIWKEEEIVSNRLRDLNVMIPIPREKSVHHRPMHALPVYQNNAFEGSMDHLNSKTFKRSRSASNIMWANTEIPNNISTSLPYSEEYQYCSTQSEFNASVFVPNVVVQDHQNSQTPATKKTQSLVDLRYIENGLIKTDEKLGKQWQPWMSQSIGDTTGKGIILPPIINSNKKGNPTLTRGIPPKYASLDAINEIDLERQNYIIKNRTGFYAQPLPTYGVPIYYGPLDGPDFLIYKKQIDKLNSKNSLSNTSMDDVQKYRDIAL